MQRLKRKLTIPYGAVMAAIVLAVFVFGIVLAAHVNAESNEPVGSDEHLITIHDKGEDHGVLTSADTLREAFDEAGITINKHDMVEPSLDETLVASHYDVNVYRARPVTVVDGNTRTKIMSPYQTPEQIAEHANISLQDEDIAIISVNTDIVSQGAGLELTIDRATPFTFVLYGEKIDAYTQASTVWDMLTAKDITLGEKDELSVPADTPITAGMTVKLWRNGKQTITVDEKVPFGVEQIQDLDRPVGYKDIKTPGVPGKRTVTYEIVMQNGVEISRKEIQSVVTKQPKKQVEVVGAKFAGPEEIMSAIRSASAAKGINATRVLKIAYCESKFNPMANSGYYKGIFQHDPQYWPARAARYGYSGASIYDVQAQIGVSTSMMAEGGWSHWGCDPGPQ